MSVDRGAAGPRLSYRDRENAMTAPDHKMYWDLLETLQWIGTRDEGGITAMGDIDEKKRTPLDHLHRGGGVRCACAVGSSHI